MTRNKFDYLRKKYKTTVKEHLLQNKLAENCDKVWNIFAMNKLLPDEVKTHPGKTRSSFHQKKKNNKKGVSKAMRSFNENYHTKNVGMSVSDVENTKKAKMFGCRSE